MEKVDATAAANAYLEWWRDRDRPLPGPSVNIRIHGFAEVAVRLQEMIAEMERLNINVRHHTITRNNAFETLARLAEEER